MSFNIICTSMKGESYTDWLVSVLSHWVIFKDEVIGLRLALVMKYKMKKNTVIINKLNKLIAI